MSVFSDKALEARAQATAEPLRHMQEKGVRFSQFEMPDINGYMRAKLMPLTKSLSAAGSGCSTLIMSGRSGDMISFTPWSNFENGFPKMVAVGDLDTLIDWPWSDGMSAILSDIYMEDGTPCPLAPRHILRRAIEACREQNLEPKATLEYEVYLFHADDELLDAGAYDKLRPFGRGPDFYSVTRFPHFEELAKKFLDRMVAVGIDVDVFHTEYGAGMFEFALGVEDALTAADNAVRAKLYFKQLCAEFGLVATFMPALKLPAAASCSGAHINVSLWRDGQNAFWDSEKKSMSALAENFAAGILRYLPDLHALYRPWINSYRRFDHTEWNPINTTWGMDNHTVALRGVTGAVPAKACRFEHRVAGPDINPYLGLAGCLFSGIRGIKDQMRPPAPCKGNAGESDAVQLPSSLRASASSLRESTFAREVFGDLFVEHFAQLKDDEVDEFKEATAGLPDPDPAKVTAWEFERYFEWS